MCSAKIEHLSGSGPGHYQCGCCGSPLFYLVPDRTWCHLRGAWKSGMVARTSDLTLGMLWQDHHGLWCGEGGEGREGKGGREVCSVARALP